MVYTDFAPNSKTTKLDDSILQNAMWTMVVIWVFSAMALAYVYKLSQQITREAKAKRKKAKDAQQNEETKTSAPHQSVPENKKADEDEEEDSLTLRHRRSAFAGPEVVPDDSELVRLRQ